MTRVGDFSQFSPGLGADVWHCLLNRISTAKLVGLYVLIEVLLIVLFALLFMASEGGEAALLGRGENAEAGTLTQFPHFLLLAARTFSSGATLGMFFGSMLPQIR
jgi:hypothetical protein